MEVVNQDICLFEHHRGRKNYFWATMRVEYVEPDADDCNLHGDVFNAHISIMDGDRGEYISFDLPCGDPAIYHEMMIEMGVERAREWANTLCHALEYPPDLWPIGD